MKTDIHFWWHLAHFFPEREMFGTKVVEKIKTHILWPFFFFEKKSSVYEITWENADGWGAGHRWQYGARALDAGYLRLQTHTQNMLISIEFFFFFLCNNGWTNVPRCYVFCVHWLWCQAKDRPSYGFCTFEAKSGADTPVSCHVFVLTRVLQWTLISDFWGFLSTVAEDSVFFFFWYMTPCHWVIVSTTLRSYGCPHLWGSNCLILFLLRPNGVSRWPGVVSQKGGIF